MIALHLVILILAVALICIGKWFAPQPFGRWFYGAGCFLAVVWVILVLASFIGVSVST